MLLSPYSNPPYRTPTPKATSSSPPPDPSPKRKRTNSNVELEINTQLHVEAFDVSGSNSPRTKVADKFRELDLRHQAHPSAFRRAVDGHRAGRKRVKLEVLDIGASDSSDPVVQETPQRLEFRTLGDVGVVNEIAETPDCYPPRLSSPTPMTKAPDPLPEDSVTVAITRHESTTPPSCGGTQLSSEDETIERALSPLPTAVDISPDQAALTWQDDEITGHEVDLGGDDDGEGINGIGFRPTPAIAYARQQRRKQQVSEWKAREARDARQRRIERRRGNTVGSIDGFEAELKRTVRFADLR